MRILHLADLHLGKRLNDLSLLSDQEEFLAWVLATLKNRDIDVLLIAGDVFDRSIPPTEAVSLLDRFLSDLVDLGKSCLIIPGNHDSAERLGFVADLLASQGVYIAKARSGFLERFVLDVGGIKVCFDLLPFIRGVDLLSLDPDAEQISAEAAIQRILADNPLPAGMPAVLLAHQFVSGGKVETELGESERAYVGPADQVSVHLFEAYSYVALGHIHRPQALARPTCRYAGAPMAYRFSEAKQERTCPIIEFRPGQAEPEVDLITIPQGKALITWQGEYADLLAELLQETDLAQRLKEAYVEVILTDLSVPDRAFARLREDLPNLVSLSFSGLTPGQSLGPETRPQDLSLETLFANFYLANTGTELEAGYQARLAQEIKALDYQPAGEED